MVYDGESNSTNRSECNKKRWEGWEWKQWFLWRGLCKKSSAQLRPPEQEWFDNFIGKIYEVTFDVGVLLADTCSMLWVLKLTNIAANQALVAGPICWFSVKLRR
jgi:hypothetical protein